MELYSVLMIITTFSLIITGTWFQVMKSDTHRLGRLLGLYPSSKKYVVNVSDYKPYQYLTDAPKKKTIRQKKTPKQKVKKAKKKEKPLTRLSSEFFTDKTYGLVTIDLPPNTIENFITDYNSGKITETKNG